MNVIFFPLTINSQANRTFYIMDCLAGGLACLFGLFHDTVCCFCVDFALFSHLIVAHSNIFQSCNLITFGAMLNLRVK